MSTRAPSAMAGGKNASAIPRSNIGEKLPLVTSPATSPLISTLHSARAASPSAVFSIVTDVSRLPEWNEAITDVVEAPEHLEAGSVWKVCLHALGQTWVSKSQVSVIDSVTGRFAYRSQSDDGNPSYVDWEWQVDGDPDGSIVTLTADINPIPF